jgi:hypothetical protein
VHLAESNAAQTENRPVELMANSSAQTFNSAAPPSAPYRSARELKQQFLTMREEGKKAEILKFQAMSDDELDKLIAEKEAGALKAMEDWAANVATLMTQFDTL